jgi:ABC-2 type transport system ATP-binding protein
VSVLTCSSLEKRYGDLVAVDGVSFEVGVGETYGLLGPNGAGKTTTISLVCGLLSADAGDAHVVGEPVGVRLPAPRRHLGYVPQELAVYPDLTARENLTFFGRLQGLDRTRLRARTGEVLEVTGLTDRADDRADTFSGGMKRRLNIGIGLLHEPQLLVLDEPTVGVDPQSRNAILGSIEQLAGAGMAVLYTTHYMEEAERLCDRIGIIDEGRLIAEGTRHQLVADLPDGDRVVLQVEGDTEAAVAALEEDPEVTSVAADGDEVVLTIRDAGSRLPDLLRRVADAGGVVGGVEVTRPDLETVFLHLTGKALRD